MGLARLPAVLAALFVLIALAAPVAATAAERPSCEGEVWSRPGLDRLLRISCSNSDRVRIAEQPAHGIAVATHDGFEGLAYSRFGFRLVTDADAPELDRLALDLDGPGGSARSTVTIHNVPLDRNTPPRCEPVSTALHTDGAAPALVEFYVSCRDDEHDDFTLHGSGPGTHLFAPMLVRPEESSHKQRWWHYRTAVSSGDEQTSYWAIDSQGAKSPEAPISLKVGRDVDRLPTCRPNPAYYEYDPPRFRVSMRAGITRHLGILCEDADGDPVNPRVEQPPLFGARVTQFEVGEPRRGGFGTQRSIDVTYVPPTGSSSEVPFTVVAGGPHGDGPPADIRMRPRALPPNGGGSCGFSGGTTSPGVPVTLEAWCADEEGDELTATITEAPAHGNAGEPVRNPGRYGVQAITLSYEPEEGFEGSDFVTVEVNDGHGWSQELEFPIGVSADALPPPPPQYAPGVDPGGWAWSPASWPPGSQRTAPPSVDQAPALNPADQARRALRTRSVRLVRRLGRARIYAPRRPPRPAARLRALAATCSVRCVVESSGALAGGRTARRARTTVSPGRARVLTLHLTAAQRRSLRRTSSGRAVFRVTARPIAGRKRSGRITLLLRG